MGGGAFEIGDKALRAPPEKGVKDHRGDADAKTAAGVDERFANAFRKQNVT